LVFGLDKQNAITESSIRFQSICQHRELISATILRRGRQPRFLDKVFSQQHNHITGCVLYRFHPCLDSISGQLKFDQTLERLLDCGKFRRPKIIKVVR
jgi:hypothetical protein